MAKLYVPSLEERGSADKIAIFEGLLERMLPAGFRTPAAILKRIGTARFDGNVRQLRNVADG